MDTIVEPVAKDNGSRLLIQGTTINGDLIVNLSINSTQANAVQNGIRRQLDRMKEPATGVHHQVLLYWDQARNSSPKKSSGDRAVIESIHPGAVKVAFATDDLKRQMLFDPPHPFQLAFVVDVAVETIKDRPALYRVTALHDTIDRGD